MSYTSELDWTSTTDPCLYLNLGGHKKIVRDISFNPANKKQFASCSDDLSIMVWNSSDKVRCYQFHGHSDIITSVDYSNDGRYLASSSKDHTVRLWVPTIRGGSTEFKAHTASVNCVSFNADNSKLITGSNDKSVKLWDAYKRQFISSFLGHNNWVKCARASPNNDMIVSCSEDHTVRVWAINNGQEIHTFRSPNSIPNYISIHRHNYYIAVGMASGSVRIYDLRYKKLQQHYTLHDNTTCLSWHPSQNYLLSSGIDGKLRIIDVVEGRPLYTLSGHDGSVFSCKFSTDGEYFASGGADKRIMVWETNFVASEN